MDKELDLSKGASIIFSLTSDDIAYIRTKFPEATTKRDLLDAIYEMISTYMQL